MEWITITPQEMKRIETAAMEAGACTGEALNITYPSGEYIEYVVFTQKAKSPLAQRPEVLDMGDYYRVAGYSKFYHVDKKTLLATEED